MSRHRINLSSLRVIVTRSVVNLHVDVVLRRAFLRVVIIAYVVVVHFRTSIFTAYIQKRKDASVKIHGKKQLTMAICCEFLI